MLRTNLQTNFIYDAKHSPLSSNPRRPSGMNLTVHTFRVIFEAFSMFLLLLNLIVIPNFSSHSCMKKKLHCEHIKSKTRLTNVNDKFANVFSVLPLIFRRVSQELFYGI